ncbi:MAG: hypothetical protein IIC26_00200 [Chloroflexi bacterium]|nr:hypothetical protein [Chloroflexota bacterium]
MRRALSWLGNALIMAGLVVRQGILSFRYNWGIALLSIVLALSLWIYVTDRENPDVTDWLPFTVAVEEANRPPLLAMFPPLQESIRVRVRAPESLFERLTAEDFRATVDLAGATGGRTTVDVNVESRKSRAVVVDFSPETLSVTLENVVVRTVPVRTQLVGVPPRGFEAREITVEPGEAVVTGPESLVSRVEAVEVDVNLTGIRSDFEQPQLLLQARDASGSDIQGVSIEPESAFVRAEIVQLEFSIDIIVRPDVSGLPAAGYNVTAVQADPATVVVTGSLEVLQGLDVVQGILTETVSIEGTTASVVRAATLQLPEGASIDQTIVTVRVTIEAARGQFSFDVVPQMTNLGAGLNASITPPTVRVVLEGAVPDLRAMGVNAILADIDLDGLGAGDHVVPVRVQAPPDTVLISISPPEVSVTLSLP